MKLRCESNGGHLRYASKAWGIELTRVDSQLSYAPIFALRK